MQKGMLFVVSGPSGTGKGTVCKRVKKEMEISISISMTTRKPRTGEIEGESYYFVTHDEFRNALKRNGFLEYAQVYGNYYGTPKAKVLEKLNAGMDVLLEIDIQGALNVKKAFPDSILIFLLPPSLEELEKRIVARGTETEEAIRLRLGESLRELSYVYQYDYCIINDELQDAVDAVASVIRAEHARVRKGIRELIQSYEKSIKGGFLL